MRLDTHAEEGLRLDLTSLIDVIFILLLFFVVSTTFVHETGLKVDLPKGSQKQEKLPAAPTVTLAADGRLEVNGEAVELDALVKKIRPLIEKSHGVVRLNADAASPWQKVFAVQEALVKAGVRSVSAQSQQQ